MLEGLDFTCSRNVFVCVLLFKRIIALDVAKNPPGCTLPADCDSYTGVTCVHLKTTDWYVK